MRLLRILQVAVVMRVALNTMACHPSTPGQRLAIATGLERLEVEIANANIRRDKPFFERIEADEFRFTASNGSITTKAEDVRSLDEVPRVVLLSYVPDSMEVRVYGQSAVVWGRLTGAWRRPDGSTIQHRYRFTDTFVWRDRRWQIVAGHESRLPEDSASRPS